MSASNLPKIIAFAGTKASQPVSQEGGVSASASGPDGRHAAPMPTPVKAATPSSSKKVATAAPASNATQPAAARVPVPEPSGQSMPSADKEAPHSVGRKAKRVIKRKQVLDSDSEVRGAHAGMVVWVGYTCICVCLLRAHQGDQG